MRDHIVVPARFGSRLQNEPGFDPWVEMRPKEVIICRRLMVQRARQDAALEKWHNRDIDNTKD